jgi:hypothetical protein
MLFNLGKLVATPAALDAIDAAGQRHFEFLERHSKGDWGDLNEHDRELNNKALAVGAGRILSSYMTKLGVKVWVITEADRSSTCVLLPSDY